MTHALRLIGVFYRTSVQTDMEYRADFFSHIVASFLGLITTIGGLATTIRCSADMSWPVGVRQCSAVGA